MENSFKIIDVNNDGFGVAKNDGIVYFVKNGCLEDEVSIKDLKNKKRYIVCKVDEVLKESNFKIKSKCEYFGICKNCIFQNLMYERELDFKKNKVIKNLEKLAKLNLEEFKEKIEIVAFEDVGYRNKIELKVKDNSLGYFKRKTNDIVKIKRCNIADEDINKVINRLSNEKELLKYFSEIYIRKSKYKNMLQINFSLKDKYKIIEELEKEVINILRNIENETENKNEEEINIAEIYLSSKKEKINKLIMQKEEFLMQFLEYKFKTHPKSFFQVNTKMAEKIYKDIKNEISKIQNGKEGKLLDLYSGVGVSSVIFSDIFKEIISIEINKEAVEAAKENAKRENKNNIKFIQGKVEEEILKQEINENDFIFVDPPRAGLNKNVIDKIIESNIKKLIYMSCSSDTLARDIKLLNSAGYNLKYIKIYDMFPRTLHVESVSIIQKIQV